MQHATTTKSSSSSALDRHQTLLRVHAGGAHPAAADLAALHSHFQFLRDDAADAVRGGADWRVRLSARYYRRLFREYALADLSRVRADGRVGLRWRTAAEVTAGKGQFECGSTRCDARDALRSYELLFAYAEQGETKRCLVKVRVCEACAALLFYRKLRQLAAEKAARRRQRVKRRRRRRRAEGAGDAGKKRRRTAAAASSASDDDDDQEDGDEDEDAGSDSSSSRSPAAEERERSVHELCAQISERDAKAWSAGGVGYFEDRKGGSDRDAFKDLLV
ncbi:hypothetical protein PybrP1_006991 [[Pythium] brassicae (nom. inval.)]|nr:hypothetical protein PybrP1_006991 [[Pythium] brassicae (nom. inval.)]